MGKNLKGKSIGKGITQRKDGKYYARKTLQTGEVKGKTFANLQEAKKWLVDIEYKMRHFELSNVQDISVDTWFDFWIDQVKKNSVKYSTYMNYQNKYRLYIKGNIGHMLVREIKLLHCQNIINCLNDEGKSIKTMKLVRAILHDIFEYAYLNSVIQKNPVNRNLKIPKGKVKEPRVLSLDEEKQLLDNRAGSENGDIYEFILQTGMRFGEVMALSWKDIDIDSRCIRIASNASYNEEINEYLFGTPKSESGVREIPLTRKATEVLERRKEKINKLKSIDFKYANCVFLNENGTLSVASRYNKDLKQVAKTMGVAPFSLHSLCHTFATRCIEAGMKPKTLQKILGHSNISLTMNLYVHVTEDERKKEMLKFEEYDNNMQSVINL